LNKSGVTGRTHSSGGTKMRKVVELSDNLRNKAAVEIVKVIQKGDLKEAYGTIGKIITQMKDEDLIDKLNGISAKELVPEPDFKNP
jgi:hypothetical protein